MLRVTKEIDYGILLLTFFVRFLAKPSLTTRELSKHSGVPYRMTCKLLNLLSRRGLLHSKRGAQGGYVLAKSPDQITLAAIIAALEGPIALTDCAGNGGHCKMGRTCDLSSHWCQVSQALEGTFSAITLSSMAHSAISNQKGVSA